MLRILEISPVPEQRQAAARPEYASDLRHRLVGAEPVEGLRACDSVDAAVRERDRLCCAGKSLDTRHSPLELGAHRVDRLDGDDVRSERDELPRELSRAR